MLYSIFRSHFGSRNHGPNRNLLCFRGLKSLIPPSHMRGVEMRSVTTSAPLDGVSTAAAVGCGKQAQGATACDGNFNAQDLAAEQFSAVRIVHSERLIFVPYLVQSADELRRPAG